MPIILAVLQALPVLIQSGFQVKALIESTNGVASPSAPSEIEKFASQLLQQLPGLIDAGKDILGLVTEGAARVKLMQAENRGPTEKEKADQTARLADLDAELDKAAKA